jgi:hypothetical protein
LLAVAVLAAAPDCDFGDRHADDQQQDGGLQIGSAGDVEGFVGPGEEEVEPGGRRRSRQDPGQPVAVRGDRHHDKQQGQRAVGVGDAGTERNQHGGQPQRDRERGQHR